VLGQHAVIDFAAIGRPNERNIARLLLLHHDIVMRNVDDMWL
jgi:hypothetical protein